MTDIFLIRHSVSLTKHVA